MGLKRNCSRFTVDELNQVLDNWEIISERNNSHLNITKTTVDLRPLEFQLINPKNIDHIEAVLYHLEINIPYKGKSIKITTSETKTPKFEFRIPNPAYSFTISQEDYFEKISKWFSNDELQTYDTQFDNMYLLSTDNQLKLNNFLDYKIREWLKNESICFFDLHTEKSKNMLTLYYVFNEFSIEAIQEEIDMFKYCIDRI